MSQSLQNFLVFVSAPAFFGLFPYEARAETAVHGYEAAPGAEASPVFSLSSEGRPLFVDRMRGSQESVSYARFSLGASAALRIGVGSAVRAVRGVPEEIAARAVVDGNSIRLPLESPAPVVLFIETERGFLEKLFLLPDAPETDVPDASRPDVIDIGSLGVDGTGRTLETTRLQRALDTAAQRGNTAALRGKGTVSFPRGVYLTGTLVIPSGVTLHLGEGAVLKGSREPADYPKDVFPDGRKERGSDMSIADADARFLGEFMTFSRLLLVDKAKDVVIRGRGTIDGDGSFLRGVRNAVPNLLRVRESQGVRIEDVLFRDAAAWSIHLLKSSGVTLANVKVLNDRGALNTDGIDVDSSSAVLVEKPFVYTKDDAICLKATNNSDLLGDVRDITVRGGLVSSRDAALKLGTESRASLFEGVTFDGVDVFDSDRAFSIVVRDGATFRDIAYRNIDVGVGVTHLFEQVIGERKGGAKRLGRIENLRFESIRAPWYVAPRSNWTWYAQCRPSRPQQGDTGIPAFEGADAQHAVSGLSFRDVTVRQTRLSAENALPLAGLSFGPFVGDGKGTQASFE